MVLKWKKGHWVVIRPTLPQDRRRFEDIVGKILKVDRVYQNWHSDRLRLFDPSDSTYHNVPSYMVHEPNEPYEEVFVLSPREDFGEVLKVPPGIIVEHKWVDPKGRTKKLDKTLHGRRVIPKSSVRTKKGLYREADRATKSELLDNLHDRPKLYARRRFSQLYDDVPETRKVLYNALEEIGTDPSWPYSEKDISLAAFKKAKEKVRQRIPVPSRRAADQMTKRRLARDYMGKVLDTQFPEVERGSTVGQFIVEKVAEEHDLPMAYFE